MQRRQAMSTLAGLVAAPALGRVAAQVRLPSPLAASDSRGSIPTIDIHCHVFNARDLPIPGFVTDVYLNDQPKAIEVPAGTVIWFLSQLMDAAAISAKDEATDLEKRPRPFVGFKPLSQTILIADNVRRTAQRLTLPTPQTQSEIDALDRRIAAALAQAATQRNIPLRMPTVQERQAFLRSLAAFGNPAFTTNPQLGLTPDALALGASKSPGQLVGALYLASLLTQSRAELTDTPATLPTYAVLPRRWSLTVIGWTTSKTSPRSTIRSGSCPRWRPERAARLPCTRTCRSVHGVRWSSRSSSTA